jgi:hypothetical protein
MRWVEHVERIIQWEIPKKIEMGERDGKIPVGKSKSRWENNIKTDFKGIGSEL